MSDDDIEPNEIILQFLDGLPPTARTGVYNQISFLLMFVLTDEEQERLIQDAADVGEAKVKQLLSSEGSLSLLGGTVSG